MRRKIKHASGIKTGVYKSQLENNNAEILNKLGVDWEYEPITVTYLVPAKVHKYTPDFVLTNASHDVMFIETKGYLDDDERKKFKHVRAAHPTTDIRFVFANWLTRISPKSKTTYKQWAEKLGFLCANKTIPKTWILEFLHND